MDACQGQSLKSASDGVHIVSDDLNLESEVDVLFVETNSFDINIRPILLGSRPLWTKHGGSREYVSR